MKTKWLLLISPLTMILGFVVGYVQPPGASTPGVVTAPSNTVDVAAKPEDGLASPAPALQDIDRAIAQLALRPSRLRRGHDLAVLLDGLSSSDLRLAAQAALQLPVDERSEVLEAVYAIWAERDPAAACGHAMLLKGEDESNLLQITLRTWMGVDPAAVRGWLSALPPDFWLHYRTHSAAMQAALGVAKDDPGAVAPLVLELCENFHLQPVDLAEFFRLWAARDLGQAASEALTIKKGGSLRSQAVRAVAELWAGQDPSGALHWLAGVQDEETRAMGEAGVLGIWVNHDPGAAAAFAARMTDERARNSANAEIAIAILDKDPLTAAALAQSVPLTHMTGRFFYFQWAMRDGAAAIGALAGRVASADPATRRDVENHLSDAFSQWMAVSPASAAAFATEQPEAVRDLLVEQAAETWLKKDRPAAIAWGMALPEGPLRDSALRSLAARWAMQSTNEAAEWVRSFPTGAARDAAIAGFARTSIRSDPEGTLSWVRSISDPQSSAEALAQAWLAWGKGMEYRPESLRWLETVEGLTPLERASLERAERSISSE